MALLPSYTIVENEVFSQEPRPIASQIRNLRRIEPAKKQKGMSRRSTLDAVWRLEINAYTSAGGTLDKGEGCQPCCNGGENISWLDDRYSELRTNIHTRNPWKSVCISAQVTDSESRDRAQTKKTFGTQKRRDGTCSRQGETHKEREREREETTPGNWVVDWSVLQHACRNQAEYSAGIRSIY
ncbi:unnamed protein product, partial [Heterotrigona itama]